jgi:hypothetical protein
MSITREELVGALLRRVSVSRERREETVEVMMLTCGSHQSARGERGLGTVSGAGRCWAMGFFWSWARSFPRGPFLFLFLLFSFSISVFFIFHKLFKFDPNRSKPTLQSFNNSKQPYRTVINRFS